MVSISTASTSSVLRIPSRLRNWRWIFRSRRAKASSARTPTPVIPDLTQAPVAANNIIVTTTITHHSSDADASEESNNDHGSGSRRCCSASYQELPMEIRIQIWEWLLVDDRHPSQLWAVEEAVRWPAMFVSPVGNCYDDASIYTERRRVHINSLLSMRDAAAKHAVYRRFKPVPAGMPWQCTRNEFPAPSVFPCGKQRKGQCCEWECPLERAAGCQCGIIWVDPEQDVFVLPGSLASMRYNARYLSTDEKRKSCSLHGGARFKGHEVIRNVLISSEAFMNRTVSGKLSELQVEGPGNATSWPMHDDEAMEENRAALLRLPSLQCVYLLVNAGMWEPDWKISHWAFILRARLHLYGKARRGPRDWRWGMTFADIMTDTQSDEKVRLEDFAECWEPFEAKNIDYQCLLWDKDRVYR